MLTTEIAQLGGENLAATQGGVGFTGPFDLCYTINLESRIASRILWQISRRTYRHEQDLYDAAYALPWQGWFSPDCTIKVKVSAQRCPLKSLDFVTLRIKDAVCDKFISVSRSRPTVDTQRPDIRIDAFLDEQTVTLYLDTSGEPLFKRGLRQARSDAPLRENLAAGLLALSGWTPDQTLLDPMCGGGTILTEAALIARRIAPGLGRRFAFERFNNFSADRWRNLREASRSNQRRKPGGMIHGSDRDGAALQAARANLEAAGLAQDVRLTQADVLDLAPPAEEGILIANPPYGVRLGEAERLAEFYPRLGDALKKRFAGWRVYLFTADQRLPKLIGLAPSRRTPLFNGALECRLYEFKLVRGPMRRDKCKDEGPAQAGG
ncbi:MAG: class I SAM-dependent RNA methyltransferase [Nitrospira sp.]|nr:class I SAM-dependent RNA methyltransferase [Nitrospira sp.]